MTAHHLIDGCFGCLVALTALWCASSKQHWAVRWGVVTAIALVSLLANAFEPVIQFMVAVVVINVALELVRQPPENGAISEKKSWQRISLRDLLLMTMFAAIAAAVFSKMPVRDWSHWLANAGIGVAAAACTLLCVWVVFGRLAWWKRLLLGGLLTGVCLVFGYAFWMTWHLVVSGWFNSSSVSWSDIAGYYSSAFYASFWFDNLGLSACLAMAMLCWLLLSARLAGWGQAEPSSSHRWFRWIGRLGLGAPVALILLFMFSLLWRLTHPVPLPTQPELPSPNGWDGILAAGAMISEQEIFGSQTIDGMSDKELSELITRWAPIHAKLDMSLKLPVAKPLEYDFLPQTSQQEEDSNRRIVCEVNAAIALRANVSLAERRADVLRIVQSLLKLLRFRAAAIHAATLEDYWLENESQMIVDRLEAFRKELDIDLSKKVLLGLLEFDEAFPSDDTLWDRQQAINQNSGWQSHMQMLAAEIDGSDPYQDQRYRCYWERTTLRLVIMAYALDIYYIQNGRYPETSEELVPVILPAVPIDPFTDQPLVYRPTKDSYELYSVGHDEKDDGGKPMEDYHNSTGDITLELALKY